MSARTTALAALIACRRRNAWSDGILKEYIARDGLDRRDAALASRLCYGVLQNRMLLDFDIGAFLKGKLRDLQPVVLDILRLGVYQLVMTDKIPAKAGGRHLCQYAGVALETQHAPDSPNHPEFPSTVLKPGEKFKSHTAYRFGVEK